MSKASIARPAEVVAGLPASGGGTEPGSGATTTPNPTPGGPGCNVSDSFPSTSKGAAPITRTYTFINSNSFPLTLQGATIHSADAGLWAVDATNLKGTLAPGATVTFSVTFTPPTQ